MSRASGNPFWDFSLRVYGQPGVAAACLRLQDQHDVDVNLLLYFCWLASRRAEPLDAGEIEAIVRATADWRDGVVRPLRTVRRRMKEGFDSVPPTCSEPLRSDIKRVELESERLQQAVLFERAAGEPAVPVAADVAAANARTNVDGYFGAIGVTIGKDRRIDCERVIDAAFPQPRTDRGVHGKNVAD